MKRSTFASLLCAVLTSSLVSCATNNYADPTVARPYVPRVSMPNRLNPNENQFIREVESSLQRNGLQPTDRDDGDYTLEFSIEDGPVNADTTLTLYQRRSPVARGYARVGGPAMMFKRQQYIRDSFYKALRQFDNELPRPGYGHEGYDRDGYGAPMGPSGPAYGQPTVY